MGRKGHNNDIHTDIYSLAYHVQWYSFGYPGIVNTGVVMMIDRIVQ